MQVIRYDNRIEIINAGYSLKPELDLGTPGSVIRNRIIAPVFHDTNLAETKGSGIRRMCRLMAEAHMAAPTYESDRTGNTFAMRLLLHHFLGEEDLAWLARFNNLDLDDDQKKVLIFLREAGAVDNRVYRQLSGCDTLKASAKLTALRDYGLLVQKGRGSATYYVPGDRFAGLQDNGSAMPNCSPTMPDRAARLEDNGARLEDNGARLEDNEALRRVLQNLKRRMKPSDLEDIIVDICKVNEFERVEISKLIRRDETYIKAFLARLVKSGRLRMKYPEMPNHPRQTYRASGAKSGIDEETV